MGKDKLNRKTANELYFELTEKYNSLEKIKKEIENRYNFLYNKYKKEIININENIITNHTIDNRFIFMIKYINDVEEYLKNQNNIVQGKLF